MRPHTKAMICRAWIAGGLAMVACSTSSSTPRETAEPASSTPQVTTSSTVPTSSTPSSTTLIWSDEFNDGDQPSSQWWNFETGYGPDGWGWGNNEWQLYTSAPENVRIENGNLVLSALCPTEPCGVRDGTITSARITTKGKFDFRYGRIEARIKPPVGKAAWPAFWALGSNIDQVSWPRCGEIDFLEMHNYWSNNATAHTTLHWCDESTQVDNSCYPDGWTYTSQSHTMPASLGDDFHVFETEWNETQVIGRVDGITYFSRPITPATMEEFHR